MSGQQSKLLRKQMRHIMDKHPMTKEFYLQWSTEIPKARERNAERKALVLNHEDLKGRLTQSPLDFKHPDQWNGYVPKVWVEETSKCEGGLKLEHPRALGRGRMIHNDSATAKALQEIYEEAQRREVGGDVSW